MQRIFTDFFGVLLVLFFGVGCFVGTVLGLMAHSCPCVAILRRRGFNGCNGFSRIFLGIVGFVF